MAEGALGGGPPLAPRRDAAARAAAEGEARQDWRAPPRRQGARRRELPGGARRGAPRRPLPPGPTPGGDVSGPGGRRARLAHSRART